MSRGLPNGTVIFLYPNTGDGVTLTVMNPSETLLEGNIGSNTILSIFFMANVTQPLGRLAIFQFALTSDTTATLGQDYNLQDTEITVPFNFAGIFFTRFNLVILGDDMDEFNVEVIEGTLEPISDLDVVMASNIITINIVDDDGECI